MSDLDFNDAGEQRQVIPEGTILVLQMTIQPGNVGDGGWLTKSKDSSSENLAVEFIVVTEGQYHGRKFKQRFTMSGGSAGHEEARAISRNTLRAILESARGIKPNDKSEAAIAVRKMSGWGEFNNLRFLAKLGVEPPQNGYAAKNKLGEIITAERKEWKQVEQIIPASATAAAPSANITRPEWAK